MVGKQPLKSIDLKAVEDQIENAKYGDLYSDDNETIENPVAGTQSQNPFSASMVENSETKSAKEQSKRSLTNYNAEDDDPFAVDTNEVISKNVYATSYDELFNEFDNLKPQHRRKNRKRPEAGQKLVQSNSGAAETGSKKAQTEVSEKFSDFDDIQLKLTPEQEMDIQKFSQSLDERPQQFHFDVDKYVADQQTKLEHKSLFKPVVNQGAPRKFFEFDDNIESGDEVQPLMKRDETVGQDDEDDPNQNHEEESKIKRDMNAKFEAYRNMVREQNSAPPVSYDVDSFYANSYKKQLEKTRKETKDKFLDNYYFPDNNGVKDDVGESKVPAKHEEMIPNSIDLDIDLKLNKEFQDLQFERDRVLHRDVLEDDMTSNKHDGSIDTDIYNDIR